MAAGNADGQHDCAGASNTGYCHCCRNQVTFIQTGSWLRDQYLCSICHSIPRQRHIQHVLDTCFSGWESLSLHESSPSNDLISRHAKGYSASQYMPGHAAGAMVGGIRNENLESLSFDDQCFDLVITQDVFEHVFHPDRAASEIQRVLKPGGAHVFTAPMYRNLLTSRPRARLNDGRIEHLLEESYHGSPVGDGRALVTWDYGLDFPYLISQWSGGTTTTYLTRDSSLGLDGEFLEVFVTQKR